MQPKRIVIVGAGFGGLAAAKGLAGSTAEVTLVDRSNHHLFQPLLYQVATAAIAPSDIAAATRSLFGSSDNVRVLMDEVLNVDSANHLVLTAESGALPYDYLILATGADYSFFGHNDWAEFAPVLKTMEDALSIRERLLAAFELAERVEDSTERRRLLTCIVVGAGPTGVEMAGAIAELGRTSLARDFRRIQLDEIRIILVEAGKRILSAFEPYQSQYALDALTKLGVEVQLATAVDAVDADGATLAGKRVAAANVIWSAGTRARDCASWIDAPAARNGAVIVKPDCSVPGKPEIFVIGDGASYSTEDGKSLPGLAPVAKQQGHYVARLLLARMQGRPALKPFQYRNWGMLAVIGRSKAVADFGWFRLSGFAAWLTWSLVHLFLLVDFRSRSSVYLAWTYAWFTRGRIARLLTRSTLPRFRGASSREFEA